LSLVVIAHRLSTINKFDKIIYLKEGSVVDQGNFAYLIGKYPDLAEQAELMKL
jgi:ABC-type multidrug transport system fused ATPase/permease subunit